MSKTARATICLMIATILAKILGFVREQVLTFAYGADIYSDVFITASKIPTIVFAAIGSAIATTVIPMYNNIKKDNGEAKANLFLHNVTNITIIISLIISIIILIFTKPVVSIFALGFEGEKLDLTINFTRIMILGIIFVGINHIIVSYLQIKEQFLIPGMIGVPYSIIIIIFILLSKKTNVTIMAYGALIATICQTLFILPFAFKKGYKYSFNLNLKDKYIKQLIILLIPVLIGGGVYQLNSIVDGTLASTLGDGIVSSFNYAYRLYTFVSALFITSIVSIIYPKLSEIFDENNKSKFKECIENTTNIIAILSIPIGVGTLILAEPIIRILFERGAFTNESTIITSNILRFYVAGMLALGLRDVIARAFYSLGNTKTPMINGSIAIIINIILNIILIKPLGYIGLAIASTISSYIGIYLLYSKLEKEIGDFGKYRTILIIIKSIIASTIMGIITLITYNYILRIIGSGILNQVISLSMAIIIGALTYFIMLIIFKVDEVRSFLKKLNVKVRN